MIPDLATQGGGRRGLSRFAPGSAARRALSMLLFFGAVAILFILLRSLGVAIMWRALLELVP